MIFNFNLTKEDICELDIASRLLIKYRISTKTKTGGLATTPINTNAKRIISINSYRKKMKDKMDNYDLSNSLFTSLSVCFFDNCIKVSNDNMEKLFEYDNFTHAAIMDNLFIILPKVCSMFIGIPLNIIGDQFDNLIGLLDSRNITVCTCKKKHSAQYLIDEYVPENDTYYVPDLIHYDSLILNTKPSDNYICKYDSVYRKKDCATYVKKVIKPNYKGLNIAFIIELFAITLLTYFMYFRCTQPYDSFWHSIISLRINLKALLVASLISALFISLIFILFVNKLNKTNTSSILKKQPENVSLYIYEDYIHFFTSDKSLKCLPENIKNVRIYDTIITLELYQIPTYITKNSNLSFFTEWLTNHNIDYKDL